jgi:hypothetical protein
MLHVDHIFLNIREQHDLDMVDMILKQKKNENKQQKLA